MRLRATHEEIIAHPMRVGMRFAAMFIPVFLLIMWFKGNAIPFTLKSLGGIIGFTVLSAFAFGYLLKLMLGWSDDNVV